MSVNVEPINHPVLCRAERADETQMVRDVVYRAFNEAVVAELVDALRASPDWIDGLSLVAEEDGELVAHLLFTRGLLDAPQRLVDVLVLSPMSVVPERQGIGIGSQLMRYGLELIEQRADPVVFLEGDPGFYSRFGFTAAKPMGFRRPSLRIPERAFQAKLLPAYERWMTGTLVYPRTFWDLDCVGLREKPSVGI